jgi:hypothetical protein
VARVESLGHEAVVCGRYEMVVPAPHLERECALAGLGEHRLRLEAVPGLPAEPEPVEPARREHDRVEPALPSLPQARVYVAAQRLDRQRRLEREQLRLPPHRGRADPHPRPQLGRTAERIAGILTAEVGADREPLRVRGRQVLRRVNGDVDPPFEQRLLDLLDEDSAGADLAERTRAVAIAGRRDRHERKLDAGRPQRREGALGLGEREPTAATADADEHRPIVSARAARSRHHHAAGLE